MLKRKSKKQEQAKEASAAVAEAAQKIKQAVIDEAAVAGQVAQRAEQDVEQYRASHRKPLRKIAFSVVGLAALVGIALAIQRGRS